MKKVISTFVLMFISGIAIAQTSNNNFSATNIIYNTKEPAKYICKQFNGKISRYKQKNNFMGTAYRCDINKAKSDIIIMSKFNSLFIGNSHFGNHKHWRKVRVDSIIYDFIAMRIKVNGSSYTMDVYIRFKQKSDYFYITKF